MATDWITITVKVAARGPAPSAAAVASVVRERLEEVDLGVDWVITKVSS